MLPLARHLVVATLSLEEARDTFGKRIGPIAIEQLDRKTPFEWRSHQISLGPVAIAAQQYGAAFRAVSKDASDVFSMSFPLTDVGGEASSAHVTHPIVRGHSTFVHSPLGQSSFQLGTRYRGLQLLVRANEMLGALGALLGRPPKRPLRFDPRVSLAHGVGASLERVVAFMADEVDREGGLLSAPLLASRFGEAILANMLSGHAHNYSELLAKIDRTSDPRSVRVTAEYLEANAIKPIRMTDLAAVAGVSVRALQIGFLKYRGCTPLEFLRDRRLDLARAQLLAGSASTSIAEIARGCGFAHLGRFSARYRARFRELPTETRARAR
jgi:AraC-like DNA-binding protein